MLGWELEAVLGWAALRWAELAWPELASGLGCAGLGWAAGRGCGPACVAQLLPRC